jgi:hypothetical protein
MNIGDGYGNAASALEGNAVSASRGNRRSIDEKKRRVRTNMGHRGNAVKKRKEQAAELS